jgi:hypothetical protein
MTTNANPQLTSWPAPNTKIECLPEGKRILTTIIDFTQIAITRGAIAFPEFNYNPTFVESIQLAGALVGFQEVDINLSQSVNGQNGLSEVRAAIIKWSPYYTAAANVGAYNPPNGDALPLYITNTQTQQTIVCDSQPGDYFTQFNAMLPFYGGNSTVARFVLPILAAQVTPINATDVLFGKAIVHFLNFEPVGYMQYSNVLATS